jgi:FtsH-binding integral membrane protein
MPWIGSSSGGDARAAALPYDLPRADVARGFLGRVYRFMAFGLAVTATLAMIVAGSPAARGLVFGNRGVFLGLVVAQLLVVVLFTPLAPRVSAATAGIMFFGYAALSGVTFASVFLVYTAASIAGTFLVTAGMFAALSVYGAVTKRNLDGVGSFAFMGLVGVVLASIVNIFLASSLLYWLTTYAGVIVFTALTIYDTAKLKALGESGVGTGEAGTKLALQGALILYLDFINLFLLLLRIFGGRRRS